MGAANGTGRNRCIQDRGYNLTVSTLPATAPHSSAATKLSALEDRLRSLVSLMVAYSGGVDSAFLAAVAHRVLGSRVLAELAASPSLARRDMEHAKEFADR